MHTGDVSLPPLSLLLLIRLVRPFLFFCSLSRSWTIRQETVGQSSTIPL